MLIEITSANNITLNLQFLGLKGLTKIGIDQDQNVLKQRLFTGC